MKTKSSMTSSDISIVLNEFKDKIENYSIDNVYGINNVIVIRLKGFSPDFPRQVSIVIEPGKRFHLTEYKRTFPTTPSDKILTFRKFIKKGLVKKCSQHGSDRIIIFKIQNPENNRLFSLYCEFFGRGNFILVEHLENEDGPFNRVLYALWYKVMRDRRLLPGKEFNFPPIRGKSILEITKDDLNSLSKDQLDNQIVKSLVKNFGSSGEVIEEILEISKIDKKENGKNIIPLKNEEILKSITKFKSQIESGPPIIVFNEEKDEFPSTFLPFPYSSIKGHKSESFTNFNLAIDQYFSPRELLESSEVEKTQINKIKQLTKQLNKQEEHLGKLRADDIQKKEIGNKIFSHAHLLEELFSTIKHANKKGMDWEQILIRLERGKEKSIPSASILNELDFKNKQVVVDLDNSQIRMDFTESPYSIGNIYFKLSKKAERKINPALDAISITKDKINEAEKIKEQAVIISKAKAVKKRKKLWYEAYHWSRSTNGFLIIAGRNLKENERLFKKYLDNLDIFFHADVQGAPYTILKVSDNDTDFNGMEPEPNDFIDAAKIAGIYSKAWKVGLGSVDVYSVSPDQLSFSAPSGEYLPKGSIFVEGKRQFYKIELKLFVGTFFDETYAYLFVSGNEDIVQKRTSVYTTINAPSHSSEKKSDIAKRFQHYFDKKLSNDDNPKLKTLTLNDYVLFLP